MVSHNYSTPRSPRPTFMKLREFVAEDAQLVDGPVLLEVRSQVFLLEILRHLSDKQFDGVRFFV